MKLLNDKLLIDNTIDIKLSLNMSKKYIKCNQPLKKDAIL